MGALYVASDRMSFNPSSAASMIALEEHLRRARTGKPQAVGDIIIEAHSLVGSQLRGAATKVFSLVETGAFTDAALALLDLGFPQWVLRRLIHDSGEWHCSLSRRLQIPLEFDDMAQANHAILPLAIVGALVETHRISSAVREAPPQSVSQVRLAQRQAFCCDDFR